MERKRSDLVTQETLKSFMNLCTHFTNLSQTDTAKSMSRYLKTNRRCKLLSTTEFTSRVREHVMYISLQMYLMGFVLQKNSSECLKECRHDF